MKITKKIITISVAGMLSASIIATAVFVGLQKPPASTVESENEYSQTDFALEIPSSISTETKSNPIADQDTESKIWLDVGGNTKDSNSNMTKNPTISNDGTTQGTKSLPSTDNQTVTDNPSANTPAKGSGGSVVGVTPVERPDEPVPPSGAKPQATDWISINSNIPAELYSYDYTVVDQSDLLTGKQLEYRGFRDWEKAAEAAVGALTTYYTVDYNNIGSTIPADKAPYLRSLVYWVGESAETDICDYMQSVKDNKVISRASVITDGSLIYNNGVRLIRARVFVTFESGASVYGLENDVKYYKDVEVSVYASTGEDRYGYGEGAAFNALLFSDNCFNTLCDFKIE